MKKPIPFRITAALLCGLLLLSAAGCSSKAGPDFTSSETIYHSGENSYDALANDYAPEEEVTGDYSYETGASSGFGVMEYAESRKVIKTARYSLETKDYDATLSALEQKLTETGGYVEQSESWGDPAQGSAQTSLTLRIPADSYHAFRDFVPTLGNVTSSGEGGEDVTEQYFDAETRLTVLRAQETRLLELLNQAGTIEEMLQVENHLTSVRIEIEQLTTLVKRLDSLTSMATVTLEIVQAREYTPQPEDTFGARLLRAFQDSWNAFAAFCQDILFFFIHALPFLLLLAALFLLIFLPVRRQMKKRPKPQLPQPPQNIPQPPQSIPQPPRE